MVAGVDAGLRRSVGNRRRQSLSRDPVAYYES